MTDERGSLRPLLDSVGGILSNPVVLEGLIAGISAVSASRRTKNSGLSGSDGASKDSFPIGGIIDMLPSILPLLSVFSGAETGGAPATENDSEPVGGGSGDEEPSLFGDTDDAGIDNETAEVGAFGGSDGDMTVSYGSPESQRENLLLAIRPFLSESRRSAADAMVQVNKLSGLFRQR